MKVCKLELKTRFFFEVTWPIELLLQTLPRSKQSSGLFNRSHEDVGHNPYTLPGPKNTIPNRQVSEVDMTAATIPRLKPIKDHSRPVK